MNYVVKLCNDSTWIDAAWYSTVRVAFTFSFEALVKRINKHYSAHALSGAPTNVHMGKNPLGWYWLKLYKPKFNKCTYIELPWIKDSTSKMRTYKIIDLLENGTTIYNSEKYVCIRYFTYYLLTITTTTYYYFYYFHYKAGWYLICWQYNLKFWWRFPMWRITHNILTFNTIGISCMLLNSYLHKCTHTCVSPWRSDQILIRCTAEHICRILHFCMSEAILYVSNILIKQVEVRGSVRLFLGPALLWHQPAIILTVTILQ